jgi:hypothetical protein
MSNRNRLPWVILLALAAGCASGDTLAPDTVEPEPLPEAPVGHTAAVVEQSGLQFTAPEGWEQQEPTNKMRKHQYLLPRAEGDPGDGELVVFHFGGGGGSVEANIERWAGQFEQEDDGSTRERATIREAEVNGMKTTFIDMGGRYKAETSPGSGERVDRPDYRMLAAVIESDHGAYYVKAIGPRATLERWSDAFESYVNSAH